jgi:hypothetical protein
MSPSSPVRTRQPRRSSHAPQSGSDRSARGEALSFVLRSIPLIVAAVSVIAASNYLAYLIGRKQVTYEELRTQLDRVVQLVGQKRVEEELTFTAPKQRQEKLEQNGSALSDLTTSTINGKTTVAHEPAPAGRSIAASLINDTAVAPPDRAVQSPESPLNAATKHREVHGVAHQRASRRQKASPTSAIPRRGPADLTGAAQPRQLTTATSVTPDASLAGQ